MFLSVISFVSVALFVDAQAGSSSIDPSLKNSPSVAPHVFALSHVQKKRRISATLLLNDQLKEQRSARAQKVYTVAKLKRSAFIKYHFSNGLK